MDNDCYAILGVRRDASEEEIGTAYRCAVRRCHPDLHPGDQESRRRFLAVQRAFDELGDPDRREAYDRGRPTAGEEPVRRPVPAWARHYRPPLRRAVIFQRTACCHRPSPSRVEAIDEETALQAVKVGSLACLAAMYFGLAAFYIAKCVELCG